MIMMKYIGILHKSISYQSVVGSWVAVVLGWCVGSLWSCSNPSSALPSLFYVRSTNPAPYFGISPAKLLTHCKTKSNVKRMSMNNSEQV